MPKPLVEINGRPMIDYLLEHVSRAGIRDVVLLTGFDAGKIDDYCGNGSKWGLSLRTVAEKAPAGTGGAVLQALDGLHPRFLVLYADTIFDFDIERMTDYHEKFSPDATLFLHPNDHPFDSDLVEADDSDKILKIHPYPHPAGADLPNLVNAAIYIVERASLARLKNVPQKPDFAKHLFPLMLEQGMFLKGYRSPEYVKDAGTPERLEKVGRDLLYGKVAQRSLKNPAPAVFIDRDGTLVEERSYIKTADDLFLLPGVGPALAKLNAGKYRTVLVTNQPVVARGECDERGLKKIHNRLESLLGADGAYLDAIYYCPHHPDKGFPGERPELKIDCECRKPKTGLLERAKTELNIDFPNSWMMGDSTTDVMTAQRAGVKSILVGTGHGGRDGKWQVKPDFERPSLAEAVELISRW